MATIPPPERIEAVKGIFRIATEDPQECGRFLNYLNKAFTGFTWASIFRQEALIWQPFIDSGLSIPQFCDEVERYAGIFAQG